MARIRTIKPEFWTDSKIVRLPYEARLLFVGIWNFCDDFGYIPYDALQIKLQVMPADQIDAPLMLEVLILEDLLEVVELKDGSSALRVKHFQDHQKVSHPKDSSIAPEVSGVRQNLPVASRRALAEKYGCEPGGSCDAECYFCGSPGRIQWPTLTNGRPSYWVCFTHTIDHFVPVSVGGCNSVDNLVLSCERCNKGRCNGDAIEFAIKKAPEISGGFTEGSGLIRREGNVLEGKGEEGKDLCPARAEQDGSVSSSDVDAVIAHYQTHHPRSRPGDKERKLIRARLKEGRTVSELLEAIDGCHVSPYHCGENPSGSKYQTLELIVRDAKHVDQFIEAWHSRGDPVLSEKTKRGQRAVQGFLSRTDF